MAVTTEFWREAHYPQPLHSAVRLLAAGADGLSLAAGLFENGQAVGAQQAWLAAWGRQGVTAQPLPSAMVAALAPAVQGGVDSPAPQRPAGSGDLHRYPVQQPYASRYGDLDADDCSSETAVMRGLCADLTPIQIAARQGVGLATIRTQIGNIRIKTGACSIRALVRQVAVLPPLVSALHSPAGQMPAAAASDRVLNS